MSFARVTTLFTRTVVLTVLSGEKPGRRLFCNGNRALSGQPRTGLGFTWGVTPGTPQERCSGSVVRWQPAEGSPFS